MSEAGINDGKAAVNSGSIADTVLRDRSGSS